MKRRLSVEYCLHQRVTTRAVRLQPSERMNLTGTSPAMIVRRNSTTSERIARIERWQDDARRQFPYFHGAIPETETNHRPFERHHIGNTSSMMSMTGILLCRRQFAILFQINDREKQRDVAMSRFVSGINANGE